MILEGRKTYIVGTAIAICPFVVAIINSLNIGGFQIGEGFCAGLREVLIGLGFVTLRLAVKNK